MNKWNEMNIFVDLFNEFNFSNSNKKLTLLRTSSIYPHNKAVALIDKQSQDENWYSINNKNCFKTWNEVEAFIEGLRLGKNTDFGENQIESTEEEIEEDLEIER